MLSIKKAITAGVAFTLSAVLTVSGVVMATDAIEERNTKLLDIDQIEHTWDKDHEALSDNTSPSMLFPYVGSLEYGELSDKQNFYRHRWYKANNVVDKYVTVKNVGSGNAYVRTIFAFEMGSITETDFFNWIGMSTNQSVPENDNNNILENTWVWEKFDDKDYFVASIDGNNYLIMAATHHAALSHGAETIPSLLQVYLNWNATNETVEKLDGNNNGEYDILIKSQAVSQICYSQSTDTSVYNNAKDALNALFGPINSENVCNWFGSNTQTTQTMTQAE